MMKIKDILIKLLSIGATESPIIHTPHEYFVESYQRTCAKKYRKAFYGYLNATMGSMTPSEVGAVYLRFPEINEELYND